MLEGAGGALMWLGTLRVGETFPGLEMTAEGEDDEEETQRRRVQRTAARVQRCIAPADIWEERGEGGEGERDERRGRRERVCVCVCV